MTLSPPPRLLTSSLPFAPYSSWPIAPPVLVLSMHSDEAYVTRALSAGATGYILKDSAGRI